jgi:hypothetical protein
MLKMARATGRPLEGARCTAQVWAAGLERGVRHLSTAQHPTATAAPAPLPFPSPNASVFASGFGTFHTLLM